ncbi:MAG: hypothetical protein ACK2T7_03815 [Anaerolineales bacterium]
MFNSDKDNERIIPRKRIDFLKAGSQVLAVLFLLLYFGYDLLVGMLPSFPEIDYQTVIILMLVLVIAVPGVFILFGKWVQLKKWQALADEVGFQTTQSNQFTLPKLHGTLRGHRMTVWQSSERRGRNRVHFTNISVTLNERIGDSFSLKKRSLTDFNQHKIGDDEFDKRYATQTTNERLINTILRTRRLRLGLLQLGERARTRSLAFQQTTLLYIESGETSDTDYLRSVMSFLSEMAQAIERSKQFGA